MGHKVPKEKPIMPGLARTKSQGHNLTLSRDSEQDACVVMEKSSLSFLQPSLFFLSKAF